MKVALSAISLIVFVLLIYIIALDDRYLLCAFGVVSILVCTIPFAQNPRIFHPLHPLILVMVSILIGTTLRSFFLAFSDSHRVGFLMFGETYEVLVSYAMWSVIGIASLVLGFMYTSKRIDIEKYQLMNIAIVDDRSNWIAIFVALTISCLGTYLYVVVLEIDLSNMQSISHKRPLEIVGAYNETHYSSLAQYRILASFSEVALLILVLLVLKARGSSRVFLSLAAFFAFLISSIVPFLGSTRSEIVMMLLTVGALIYYKRGISLAAIVIGFLLMVVIVTVMGNLRNESNSKDTYKSEGAVEAIVGSGNFFDIARTSIIIDRVPATTPFLLGISYTSLLTGMIPRTWWPDKPNVSLGPFIKEVVFGENVRNAGFPPGLVAEAYLNFGYVGIPVVLFFFGAILRIFHNTVFILVGTNDVALLIYLAVIWRLAMGGLGLNFSQSIMQVLQSITPLLAMAFGILILQRKKVK
jgi:oligosaccharide repeat unit polymerase